MKTAPAEKAPPYQLLSVASPRLQRSLKYIDKQASDSSKVYRITTQTIPSKTEIYQKQLQESQKSLSSLSPKGRMSPKKKSAKMSALDTNLIANIEAYESIQKLTKLKNTYQDDAPSETIELILSVLKMTIAKSSSHKELMVWMIDMLTKHLFLSEAEMSNLENEVKEIRVAKMMKQKMSYRKVASVLCSMAAASKQETAPVVVRKPSQADLVKGSKMSPFFRAASINPVEDSDSEKDSKSVVGNHPEIVEKETVHMQPLLEVSSKQIPSKRSNQGSKLFLTQADCPPRLESKQSLDQVSKRPSMMSLNAGLNNSSHRDEYDDKKTVLTDRLGEVSKNNLTMVAEMQKIIQQNTSLKEVMITLETQHNEHVKALTDSSASLSQELDQYKRRLSEAQDEIMKMKDVLKKNEGLFQKVKTTVDTMVQDTRGVVEEAERLVTDREFFSLCRIIKEPNLIQLMLNKGLVPNQYGVEGTEGFAEGLEKLLSSLSAKRKCSRVGRTIDDTASPAKRKKSEALSSHTASPQRGKTSKDGPTQPNTFLQPVQLKAFNTQQSVWGGPQEMSELNMSVQDEPPLSPVRRPIQQPPDEFPATKVPNNSNLNFVLVAIHDNLLRSLTSIAALLKSSVSL